MTIRVKLPENASGVLYAVVGSSDGVTLDMNKRPCGFEGTIGRQTVELK